MKLNEAEVQELQKKYSYLTNYEADEPDAPIDPLTYVDSNGDSLLHIAAQSSDVRTVELLLNAGIDVNQTGDMGNTALHYATDENLARLLLSRGASVEVYNEFGKQSDLSTLRARTMTADRPRLTASSCPVADAAIVCGRHTMRHGRYTDHHPHVWPSPHADASSISGAF
jgi:hypothetical protein